MSLQSQRLTTWNPVEDSAVRDLYFQFIDGWNKGSGEALAAPFSEDADFIAFDGTHLKGREEIASFHGALFEKYLKGTGLVGNVQSVRFVKPGVALIVAVCGTILRGNSSPAPERESIQTLIATRIGNQWKLAAFQNTRVRPIGRNVGGSFVWLFSDFLWKMLGPGSPTGR